MISVKLPFSTEDREEHDVTASTEEILLKTYDKQVAIINAQREQLVSANEVLFGWTNQLIDLLKTLIAVAVPALIAGTTIKSDNINNKVLIYASITVILVSIIGIVLLIMQRVKHSASFMKLHNTSMEYLSTLNKTLMLFNQHIDLKHSKIKDEK